MLTSIRLYDISNILERKTVVRKKRKKYCKVMYVALILSEINDSRWIEQNDVSEEIIETSL